MSDPYSQVVYVGDARLETREHPGGDPGPGEVSLHIAYTGICGTDLHILHGEMDQRVSMPAVLGHETSGVIVELGPDVDGWSLGERVTVRPLRRCGVCPTCSRGHTHICPQLDFLGIDTPGSMQERWVVPAHTLFRLPESVSLRNGAVIEPLAVATHSVGRSRIEVGDRALVAGAGPIGILISLVSSARGAEVVVSEPSSARRIGAEKLGLRTIDPTSTDLSSFVDDWTGGIGVDIGFEAAASPQAIEALVGALRPRGRLVPVGIHSSPAPIDLFRVFWRELEVIGSRLYGREDFETAITLADDGAVPFDDIITDVVPLDDAARAFSRLEAAEALKILVDCGGDTDR